MSANPSASRTLPLYALVLTAVFELSEARGTAASVPFMASALIALAGIWHARQAPSAPTLVGAYVDAVAALLLLSCLGGLASGRAYEAVHLAHHAARWSPAFALWWFADSTYSLWGASIRALVFTGVLSILGIDGLHEALQLGLLVGIIALTAGWGVRRFGPAQPAQRQRREDGMHDPKTGVASLQAFESELAQLTAISDRYDMPVTMLFVRLMDAGAARTVPGDALLVAFAAQLHRRVRTADTVCHARGGDFYLLLPNTTLEGARQIADDIDACANGLGSAQGASCIAEVLVEQHCTGEDPMCMVERAERRLAAKYA